MVRGANVVELEKSVSTDLEPYYRLIEMQKQMIDLIQRNAHTERECAALREQLAREVEALARSRRSLPGRLRDSVASLLRRLSEGNGNKPMSAGKIEVKGTCCNLATPLEKKLHFLIGANTVGK